MLAIEHEDIYTHDNVNRFLEDDEISAAEQGFMMGYLEEWKMWFKREFMEWDTYKEKIDFLDNFYWQQSVRRANMKA